MMASGSAFTAYLDPSTAHFFPVCPLFALTGFACPGCGLTRGFHALFHGDVLTALDFNALIPVWTVIFGYVFVSLALLAIRGRGLADVADMAEVFVDVYDRTSCLRCTARNLPMYPFTILFPIERYAGTLSLRDLDELVALGKRLRGRTLFSKQLDLFYKFLDNVFAATRRIGTPSLKIIPTLRPKVMPSCES